MLKQRHIGQAAGLAVLVSALVFAACAGAPEPASLVMLSSGALVGLGVWRKRRRKGA